MKQLLAPGTKKLFLYNLLWLELIIYSVRWMILLLKSVSLRAYLFPLLAKTLGVPAACKAKRYVAVLVRCSTASLACLSASAALGLQETLLWWSRVKRIENHLHLGSWSASSCIFNFREVNSPTFFWRIILKFNCLFSCSAGKLLYLLHRYSLEITFLFRFLSSCLGGCFDVGFREF